MIKEIIKQHQKGQKHFGKTNWIKVSNNHIPPLIDNENPELIGKRTFKKAPKT
jgi:hypothetical protein